jgi:hypothetical protein
LNSEIPVLFYVRKSTYLFPPKPPWTLVFVQGGFQFMRVVSAITTKLESVRHIAGFEPSGYLEGLKRYLERSVFMVILS